MRLATTANITLYGLQTIDGVPTGAGDRVLVKSQADARDNGIYTASEGQWFRAADARTSRTMQKGTTVHVQQGAVSADFVYVFQALDPVIGTDAIALAFYLSDDMLGDASSAANAAAASAAAALASQGGASASAVAAASSASGSNTSASNAAISASGAATSATNAGNSATAASGSASSAATAATNAGNSATAASGSATAASTSAGNAATSATNAATAATNAAASALVAATSVAALGYTFSATTTDADPGNGTLRLNNASAALATAAYIDNLDAGGATVSGILDAFDDSTNAVKGQLTLRSKASAAIAYVYNVTGAVVDGSGYRKLTLAYISGAGTLPTTANGLWLLFDRAGDKGADGTGVGDFSGPASSVADNVVTFNGTTGKVGKDSGVAVSSLAPKASPTFTGTPAAPTAAPGTNTTQLATTGFVKAAIDLVLGGVSAAFDTLSEIATELGLKATIASPTFTGTPLGPTAALGTNTTQLATTAFVLANTVFTKFYESAPQTITSAGLLTLAHGLGVKPKLYLSFLQCVTAEQGYAVGAEIPMPLSNGGGVVLPLPMVPDATSITIRIGANSTAFWANNFTTGVSNGSSGLTNGNWRLVVRAWV